MENHTHPTKTKSLAYSYIRFSSPQQMQGDSLRRQTDASEEYAAANGLRLDYSLNLRDLGVSAYRGRNAAEGALAGFFTAIQTGYVAVGSTLLVESLDRLSRDQISYALTQFLSIINAGVTVVTLMDRMVYSQEAINANPGSLMMSIVIMMRAHEESATKGRRVAQAWAKKRLVAAESKTPQSKLCPGWLQLTEDADGKKSYAVIPERAAVLIRIFELAAEGLGKRLIARALKREGIKPRGDGDQWADSSVLYLVNCKAAIGIYQPHCLDSLTRRRIPQEPIEGYYPQVVPLELWQRAHQREKAPVGPRSPKTSNLFTGLIIDGYSGYKMHYIDKMSVGQKRDRGVQRYLYTSNTRPDGVKAQFWPYLHFEKLVLDHLRQLDWSTLANKGPDLASTNIERQITEAEIRAAKSQADIDKFFDAMGDMSDIVRKAATARVNKMAEELEETQRTIEELQRHRDYHAAAQNSVAEGIEEFKQLIDGGDPNSRLALQMEIRRRIKSITAYRYGRAPEFKGTDVENLDWPYVVIEYRNGMKQRLMSSPVRNPQKPITKKTDSKKTV